MSKHGLAGWVVGVLLGIAPVHFVNAVEFVETPLGDLEGVFCTVVGHADEDGVHAAWMTKGEDDHHVVVYYDGKPGPVFHDMPSKSISLSDDGKRWIYLGSDGSHFTPVVDGQIKGSAHDAVTANSVLLSSGGKHWSFVATDNDSTHFYVDGIDRGVVAPAKAGGGLPIWSPDGEHYAFVRSAGEKVDAVVDDKVICQTDDVAHLSFTSKSKLICVHADGPKLTRWFVNLDGVDCGPFEDLGFMPIVSNDGSHIAWIASVGGKWSLYIDGKERRTAEQVVDKSFHFSPDGAHWSYTAKSEGRFLVCVDGELGEPSELFTKIAFSDSGQHYGYFVHRDGKDFVVIDGKAGPPRQIAATDSLTFSPDGSRSFYAAGNNNDVIAVVDGVDQPAVQKMFMPAVFSKDGQHLVYGIQQNGKAVVLLDGKPQLLKSQPDRVSDFQLSEDGQHLAYRAEFGGQVTYVLDGQPGPLCDSISNRRLYSNGKHFSFRATRAGRQFEVIDGVPGPIFDEILRCAFNSPLYRDWFVVGRVGWAHYVIVNGELSPAYDSLFAGPTFTDNGVEWIGVRAGKVLRMTVQCEK